VCLRHTPSSAVSIGGLGIIRGGMLQAAIKNPSATYDHNSLPFSERAITPPITEGESVEPKPKLKCKNCRYGVDSCFHT